MGDDDDRAGTPTTEGREISRKEADAAIVRWVAEHGVPAEDHDEDEPLDPADPLLSGYDEFTRWIVMMAGCIHPSDVPGFLAANRPDAPPSRFTCEVDRALGHLLGPVTFSTPSLEILDNEVLSTLGEINLTVDGPSDEETIARFTDRMRDLIAGDDDEITYLEIHRGENGFGFLVNHDSTEPLEAEDRLRSYDDRTILIAAMTADRVIGAGDGMPWDVPEEYAHYLSLVRGHPIVMGRRTWEIFAPDLPGETLVVLTRSPDVLPGVETATTIEDALARAWAHARASHLREAHAGRLFHGPRVFVAGGASVYAQAMPHADAMYLSTVDGDFEGDARFPEFDPAAWPVRVEHPRPGFVFRVHRRAEPYRGRSAEGVARPGAASPGRSG